MNQRFFVRVAIDFDADIIGDHYWPLLVFYMIKSTVAIILLFFGCQSCLAEGVTPYVKTDGAPMLERQIKQLAVLANIPNLNKPYSALAVFDALSKIEKSHPSLYRQLRQSLSSYKKIASVTHARVKLNYSEESIPQPNGRGIYSDEAYEVSVRGQWQLGSWFAAYAGLELSQDTTQASGSLLSFGQSWAQLDIGYKDMWLSPMHHSAQLLSYNAETLPSVSLNNSLPIEFFNRCWG